MSTQAAADVIKRQFEAVEAGDIATMRSTFAPDAVIWHNFDDREMDVLSTARMLGKVHELASKVEFQNQKITAVGSTYFIQHHFYVKLSDGNEIRTPTLMKMVVNDDNLISRVEEYLDTAALAASPKFVSHIFSH